MTKLFRVILPVSDIGKAAEFYAALLGDEGQRVWTNRHYFDCGGTILALVDPQGEGDRPEARPNQEHFYFAAGDLEPIFEKAKAAGCKKLDEGIEARPWGERSFYAVDPFGNPICFVDEKTVFTGL